MVHNPYAKRSITHMLKRPRPNDDLVPQNQPVLQEGRRPEIPPRPFSARPGVVSASILTKKAVQSNNPMKDTYKPADQLHQNIYQPKNQLMEGVHSKRTCANDGGMPSSSMMSAAQQQHQYHPRTAAPTLSNVPTRAPSPNPYINSRVSSPNPYLRTTAVPHVHKPSPNTYQNSRNAGIDSTALENNGVQPALTIAAQHHHHHNGLSTTSSQHAEYSVPSLPILTTHGSSNHTVPTRPYLETRNTVHGTTSMAELKPTVTCPPQPRKLSGGSASIDALVSTRPASWSVKTGSASTIPQPNSADPQPDDLENRPELPGEELLPANLVYDPNSIKPIKDEYRQKLSINSQICKPLLNGWTLYPHQKRSILKGLMKRRVILALDMGLGKTLIGCVWSKAFKLSYSDLKILVICPVSLKGEWKRTAEEATGLKVEEDKKPPPDSLDMAIYTWAKIPTQVHEAAQDFVAVFDEAHMMQSMDAARTQSALSLIEDKRCVGVLLLTGTPMKNGKPANLFPLLKAVGHPLGRNQRAYEKHFCDGKMVNFGRGVQWHAGGSSNLQQLNRLVEPNLLHLTKEACLAALPPMTRETRSVPISARCQNQYNDAIKDLARLREAMRTNKDLDRNAMLGATQSLRVMCAFAKIRATVEVAKSILETEEPSVVIFTNFAKAAKKIQQQLSDLGWDGSLLTGETPPKKRQALVDDFQNGLSPAFVATFGAGGVGITLTAASTIIFLDRPWTPGEIMQAEDRIRRIGQTKKTRSIWMSAFELDSQVDAMLAEKRKATNAVLANASMATSSAPATGINVQKLLASIISRAK